MKKSKRSLTSGRFHVPYAIYGEGQPRIVCVNGAQQTMAVWRSLISHFSQRCAVITFDFPGQESSRILDGGEVVAFDEQVEILARVVSVTAGECPVNLFGASWGGIVAAAYAARNHEHVGKMVLASFGMKPSLVMRELIARGKHLFDSGKRGEVAELLVQHLGERLSASFKNRIRDQFARMDTQQYLAFYAHGEFVDGIRNILDLFDLAAIKASTLIVMVVRITCSTGKTLSMPYQ